MIKKYTKYILWLAIVASLIMLGAKTIETYDKEEWLLQIIGIVVFVLLICGPYIFMLFKLRKISLIKASQIIHLVSSSIVSIAGVSNLYIQFYVLTGGISRIMGTLMMIILQWLICAASIIIERIINRRHNAFNA